MIWPFRRPPPPAGPSLEDLVGFLRSGGSFSLQEYLLLPPVIRELLLEASEVVRASDQGRAAYAGQSEYHAAEVLERADGGALWRRLGLRDAARGALTRASGGREG